MKNQQVEPPKKLENVIYYKPSTEEEPADFQSFFSFIMVFGAMIFKNKLVLWASLFLSLSSFFNMKSKQDYKQIIITSMLTIMAFFAIYVMRPPEQPKN